MSKIYMGLSNTRKVLFHTDKNVFLTGPAGTGKTTLIKEFLEAFPNTIACASTGIAAVAVGGETAHRVFHIPVPAYGQTLSTAKITTSDLKPLIACDGIIIEEISILRADAFAFLIKVLKKAEQLKGSKIRLIVIGDFAQLPPVVTKQEENMLTKFGFHVSGFSFTTSEWSSCKFEICILNEIMRQSDKIFMAHLQEARISDPVCLNYFNDFSLYEDADIPEKAVQICGTNAEAEAINASYIDSLDGVLVAYMAKKTGRPGSLPVEDVVLLKEGARVMFTANDPKRRWTNGTLGIVEKVEKERVLVGKEDGKHVWVEPMEFTSHSYSVKNGKLMKTDVGKIAQIPLKVAKAMTIHKSQGKTFDAEVLTPSIFAPGQLYVALSRVRGPEGLYINGEVTEDALKQDPVVADFVDAKYTWDLSKNPQKITPRK